MATVSDLWRNGIEIWPTMYAMFQYALPIFSDIRNRDFLMRNFKFSQTNNFLESLSSVFKHIFLLVL